MLSLVITLVQTISWHLFSKPSPDPWCVYLFSSAPRDGFQPKKWYRCTFMTRRAIKRNELSCSLRLLVLVRTNCVLSRALDLQSGWNSILLPREVSVDIPLSKRPLINVSLHLLWANNVWAAQKSGSAMRMHSTSYMANADVAAMDPTYPELFGLT